MDKPVTLSTKNWLIRKLSTELMISERVLDAVISHEFEVMREKLDVCDSIEVSGFGKFMFNKKKAERTMQNWLNIREKFIAHCNDETLSEGKRKSYAFKLGKLEADIETLKNRMNKYEDKFA